RTSCRAGAGRPGRPRSAAGIAPPTRSCRPRGGRPGAGTGFLVALTPPETPAGGGGSGAPGDALLTATTPCAGLPAGGRFWPGFRQGRSREGVSGLRLDGEAEAADNGPIYTSSPARQRR